MPPICTQDGLDPRAKLQKALPYEKLALIAPGVFRRGGAGLVRQRSFIQSIAIATVALLGCSSGSKSDPWVVKVEGRTGQQVQVQPKADVAMHAARVGDLLFLGGSLATGQASSALLVLRNGSKLKVDPNSVIKLTSGGSGPKGPGLVLALDQGRIEGEGASVVDGQSLVVAVGGRVITFGKGAKFDLSGGGLKVVYGSADLVVGGRSQAVVVGESISFAPKPDSRNRSADAGAPTDAAPAADGEVVAKELVFFLKVSGRGRVLVKAPGARRFVRVRRGRTIEIKPGTVLKLARGARVAVSTTRDGKAEILKGPAEVIVRRAATVSSTSDAQIVLEPVDRNRGFVISQRGKPGTRAAPIKAEGVTIFPRVAYRRIEMRVKKERNRSVLVVSNGIAELKDKSGKSIKIEAGQRAVLSRGRVTGPQMPPGADLRITKQGTMRLFTASRTIPMTFAWDKGWARALVEVSRTSSFRNPIFADIVTRHSLNLPAVGRGSLYWRVRPVGTNGAPTAAGARGHIALLVDTSYRVLKRWPPRNTIEPRFGNTTVYYQNALPRFTFSWAAVPQATEYRLKVYRESSLARAMLTKTVRQNTVLTLTPGQIGEGSYSWFVAAYAPGGKLLKTSKYRRLSIRYDNATPNLQIIYPRNRAQVASGSIEVRGVTFRGSVVHVNGQLATLDEGYRFKHTVALRPGLNTIRFRVQDKRRGTSLYTRQVVRR